MTGDEGVKPIRVLHIGKFYPPFAGGMENFLADLLPALQQQGVVAAALVHDSPSPSLSKDAEGIRIYRAPCYGRLLYAPISPGFPFWLHRTIREFQPDLLHLHLPNTSAFWALLVPAARRLPWVIHWHADVVASAIDRRLALAYRLYRPFEQRLLATSRAIIATSPPYLEASTALAPWRDRCRIIPLGLDPMRIPDPDLSALKRAETLWGKTTPLTGNHPTTPSPLAGNHPTTPSPLAGEGWGGGAAFRILAIGRLTYYKGHDLLIQAAAQLPDSRILIVGSGEHRQRLETLIDTLHLHDRVRLPGFQPEADLNALLARCDVLCLPSLERTEAFGLVLLEAMRFGKPVVVSDIPGSGPGWVVNQAGHGLCVPPGDPNALAAALQELQHNPVQRIMLGQAGATALQEQFGIGPVAAAITDLYRQMRDETPSAPKRAGPAQNAGTPG